jgi:8-oxo-dGTP pyrophosphatase MutT (NUDIX family)
VKERKSSTNSSIFLTLYEALWYAINSMNAYEKVKEERHFCVYLLYDKYKRFLLQLRPKHRDFLPHYWCSFGGRVLAEETPYESLKRKAFEELNYEIKKPKYVLTSTFEHQKFRAHLHVFTEEYRPRKNKLLLKDGENCGWFDVTQLETLKMQPHDRDLINYTYTWINSQRERDVSIIIPFDGKHKILLQQREDDRSFLPGYWAFFGGGIDAGENSREALIREAFEELNYKVKDPRLVMKTTFQHPEQRSNMYIYLDKCTNKKGLKLQEGQRWGWFGENETGDLKMLESDRYILSYIFEFLRKQKENSR